MNSNLIANLSNWIGLGLGLGLGLKGRVLVASRQIPNPTLAP